MEQIACIREAEKHHGTLKKTADGFICLSCWAKEQGIELRKSQHGQTKCPMCGKVLMQKQRKGGVSITNMNMKGDKATLLCDCGYKKTIKSPFASPPHGKAKALHEYQELMRRSKNGTDNQRIGGTGAPVPNQPTEVSKVAEAV